ncbi:DUF429 domain-containing protein [Paraburkholderia sp. DHOC27]|uniref:DUF429 domain-containing protein n=1 Tax=Paraburkholderia sp. DHOC27 TaxID=2303330 RepID=UPI000E3C660A|nr:DUF429 domain-containing protein [Paraburkholderia sp. DHOC27]RFU46947.1 DUF429 domain-containing protein [Paraburkholderia sp. DHOC27]
MNSERTVAGIDVGGDRKGNHLVVLRGTQILLNASAISPDQMLQECIDRGVAAVGIDAPCRWGAEGTGRSAEKALARQRISCFATPTRDRAIGNRSGFYRWMLNGERIYDTFSRHFPLFTKDDADHDRVCFETFPHAIASAFLGREVASAKQKRVQRRHILENAGIETAALTNIDSVDAALCALTATLFLAEKTHAYGDEAGGFIVVPTITAAMHRAP